MLPDVDELKLHVAQNLELCLERAFGGSAPTLTERISRFLTKIAADAARSGRVLPPCIVFERKAKTVIPTGYAGALTPAVFVKADDTIEDCNVPCSLAELETWGYEASEDTESFFLIFTRSAAGQHAYVSLKKIQLATYSEPCVFMHGTHFDILSALKEYAEFVAKRSECGYLAKCWSPKNPKSAYVLISKPEKYMRDSLWNFLRFRLRNHVVEREFTVSAKKPVDIVVDWKGIRRKAFVEVKWLGRCATTTTNFTPGRAIKGARQLRDHYVDPYMLEHGDVDLLGYLAVFDARPTRVPIPYPSDVTSHLHLRLDCNWETNPP